MEREVKLYKIDSWKWYCHTDPGAHRQRLPARRRERDVVLRAVAQARHEDVQRPQGLLLPVAHARPPGQPEGRREGGARPIPDLNFVIYHSALKHGPNEPNYLDSNKFDPTTGDFAWHDVLMNIKKRNPQMNNVYPEIGCFFNAWRSPTR